MATLRWLSWLLIIAVTWDQISTQEVCLAEKLDIVFMIDSSSSITGTNFYKIINFVADVLEDALIDSGDVRVGLITFGATTVIRFGLDKFSTKGDVIENVYETNYDMGETNIADALLAMRTKVFNTESDRRDARNVAVIITDGVYDIMSDRTKVEAQASRASDIEIYAIGVALHDFRQLTNLVSDPVDTYGQLIEDFDALSEANLFTSHCGAEIHEITNGGITDLSELGSDQMDLVFLLHFSNEMTDKEFAAVKGFITDVLLGADIDGDYVRVAAAVYTGETTVLFKLDTYKSSKKGVVDAIQALSLSEYKSADCNLAVGLNTVKRELFDTNKGDREDIPNSLFVITDGNTDMSEHSTQFDLAVADMAESDITVFAIGIGLRIPDEMNIIASTQEMSYILNDANQLPALVGRLQDRLPSLTMVLPLPTEEPVIVATEPEPEPTTPEPTPTPTPATLASSLEADIVVLFHGSNKMKTKHFNKILKEFMSLLFAKGKVSPHQLKVAFVNYGKTGNIIFNFNKYKTKQKLRQAIRKISAKLRHSRADLGAALHKIRTELLVPSAGSRINQGVPNGIILITDTAATQKQNDFQEEADLLKSMGIKIFGVGIGSGDNSGTQMVSSKPLSEYYQSVARVENLVSDISYRQNIIARVRTLWGKKRPVLPTTESRTTTPAQTLPPLVTEIQRSTAEEPELKIALVYRSDGRTPPKDYLGKLLPFLSKFFNPKILPESHSDFAFLTYGKSLQTIFNFKQYPSFAEMKTVVLNTSKKYRTVFANFAVALDAIRKNVFSTTYTSSSDAKHIIVVADKIYESGETKVNNLLQLFQSNDIKTHWVVIGNTTKIPPRDGYFRLPTYSHLPNSNVVDVILRDIIRDFMERKSVQSMAKSSTTEAISATVTAKTVTTNLDSKLADIAFLFHASSLVKKKVFKKNYLKFMMRLAKKCNLDKGKVRLAVGTYGADGQLLIDLTQYSAKKAVVKAIKKIPKNLRFKKADLAAGLRMVREKVFIPPHDRPEAQNYLVIITDSPSTGGNIIIEQEAKLLKDAGVIIYMLGIGAMDQEELQIVPSDPVPAHSQHVPSYDAMLKFKVTGKPILKAIPALQKRKKKKGKKRKHDKTVTESTTAQITVSTSFQDRITTTSKYPEVASEEVTETPHTKTLDARGKNISRILTTASQQQQEHTTTAHAITSSKLTAETTSMALEFKETTLTYLVKKETDEDSQTIGYKIANVTESRRREVTDAATTKVPTIPLSESSEADIIVAAHSSMATSREDFQKLLEFVTEVLSRADVDGGKVKAGLIIYGITARPIFYLNQMDTWDNVLYSVSSVSYAMRSNIVDASKAMKLAVNMFASAARGGEIPKALFMVTDSPSTDDSENLLQQKQALMDQGVEIFSVGVGLQDKGEIEKLASSSENVYSVSGYSRLSRAADEIRKDVLSLRILTPRPSTEVTTAATAAPAPTKPDPPIRITFPPARKPCGLARVDLVIIIDASTSVGAVNFDKQKQFVREIAENSDIDSGNVRIGVVVYSTDVDIHFQLNDYTAKADVLQAIDDIPYKYGSTNTAGGLNKMRSVMFTTANGDRPEVRNIAIIITDGVSNINSRQTIPEAELAHGEGIHIYAVGIGLSDTRELDAIASPPALENSFTVDSFDELTGFTQKLFTSICPLPRKTTPAPTTPAPTTKAPTTKAPTTKAPTTIAPTTKAPTTAEPSTAKPTSYTVVAPVTPLPPRRRTTRKPATTPAPTSYTVVAPVTPLPPRRRKTTPKPVTTTTTPAPTPPPRMFDLVIVLDSSVKPTIFQWMIGFVEDAVNKLSIDNEMFRVGLLRYSTYPDIQFNLQDHLKKRRVLSGINRAQYRPGETNTDKAFDTVRTRMFRRRSGDRPNAQNIILHLTGTDHSADTFNTWAAAEKAEAEGAYIFTVGLNLKDTTELDEISTHPLRTYQRLFNSKRDLNKFANDLEKTLAAIPPRRPRGRSRPKPPPTTPRPRPPGKCTSSGDIVFIIDSSGSVGRDSFWAVMNFTFESVNGLDIDNGLFRIGLITFSDNANREFYLNTYNTKAEIKKALQRVPYIFGSTHTAAALRMARLDMFVPQAGDRPDVPNVVVIVTDGESNINHVETIPEAMRLKRAGVSIITIAVGFTDRTTELVGLTSAPVAENLIRVDTYDSLNKLHDKLITPLCSDSDLCSGNPCQNGGVCIDGLRSYMCSCTEGFYGTDCEKTCGDPADVVFMLDSSTTVGEDTFRRMKSYTEHLIREMNVEACDIRVGVMKYSSAAMVQFQIGYYTNTEVLSRAVDVIHYTRGKANMADAFRAVRTRMFNSGYDRYGVKNVAFLLTDGSADINAEGTLQEAELAIAEGIRIVPIGIELRTRAELESIAESQGSSTIEINGEDDIMSVSDEALRPVFEKVSFCDVNPCRNGGSCRTNGNGFYCDCISGYSGDRCEKRCNTRADVVFAVDTSRHMSRKDLRRVKRFLRSIVKRMQFKRAGFRVSVVTFAKHARVRSSLARSMRRKSVLSILSGLRPMTTDPNPAEALRKVYLRVLRKARSSLPRYVIFVSKSMRNEQEVIRQANKIKLSGAKFLGVGLSMSRSDQNFLSWAVSSPSDRYTFHANSVEDLTGLSDNLIDFMCQKEDKCSPNPCKNRGTCVRVPGDYYCKCARGFAGKHCTQECNAQADVAFLLDASGSVGHQNFLMIKDFVSKVIDELAVDRSYTRVGVVSFSSRAKMGFQLDTYSNKEEMKNGLSAMGYQYGDTNTADGLSMINNRMFTEGKGDRARAKNFLVVITDSTSNVNPEKTIPEAKKLKDRGVHIYTVGIGPFDPHELRAMASEPASDNAFIFVDFNGLKNLSLSLLKATCKDGSMCDINPCNNGGECVPGINSFTCKCPRGFNGPVCAMECFTKKDVVFVLDSSSSVGIENYRTMVNFVKALVEELAGASSNNRFGLVTYSTNVRLVFSLGRYTSAAMIGHAVSYSRYTPGSTNTAGGLRTALDILSNSYGGRRDAEDIVILITDGKSNVNEYDTIPSAQDLKNAGARILTIAVGMSDYTEINQIASSPEEIFKVNGYNVLHEVKHDILESSCNGHKKNN